MPATPSQISKFFEEVGAGGEIFLQKNFSPGSLIISIDGRAASGKTTFAAKLAEELNASVVHMDDFFLPPHTRTPERLAKPGENIHHERFAEEVLAHLVAKAKSFSYRIFDCGLGDFSGMREISATGAIIVEGSYSHHPRFGDYSNLRIFCDVPPEIQLQRIEERNGKEAAKVFAEKWIPLEEQYFHTFRIAENAHIAQ